MMQTDYSLISNKALQAAKLSVVAQEPDSEQSPPASSKSQLTQTLASNLNDTRKDVRQMLATVIKQVPIKPDVPPNVSQTNNNATLLKTLLDIQGQSLSVDSDKLLPKGSLLTLLFDAKQPSSLKVLSVQLANAGQSMLAGQTLTSDSANKSPNLPLLPFNRLMTPKLEQMVQRLLANYLTLSKAATQPAPSSTTDAPQKIQQQIQQGLQPRQSSIKPNVNNSLVYSAPAKQTASAQTPSGIPTANSPQQMFVIKAGLNSLLNKLDQLPPEAAKTISRFVNSLPDTNKMATSPQVRQSLEQSPIRYEQLVLKHVNNTLDKPTNPNVSNAQTQLQTTQSNAKTAVSQIFQQLWSLGKTAKPASDLATTQVGSSLPQLNGGLASSIEKLPNNLKAVLMKAIQDWPTSASERQVFLNTGALKMTDVLPDSLRLLQTGLAHIEQEQIRQLQNADNTQQQTPLLWRDGEKIQQALMEMEEYQQQDPQTGKKVRCWHLVLHFDLDNLGAFDVELDLSLPKLSARFWSENANTLSRIQQALPPLRKTLNTLGAEIDALSANRGRKSAKARGVIHQSLVDVHT